MSARALALARDRADERTFGLRRFGRYTVLRALGSGAMGEVLLAHDPKLDRKVALKLVHAELEDQQLRTRMQREAQALAKLAHPNVTAIYDVGMADDRLFMAMQFVQGRTLREWLAESERSQPSILQVLLAIARGIDAAHRAEVVHRDLKPDNVMIDDAGTAYVLDFGLARLGRPREFPRILDEDWASRDGESSGLTSVGTMVGTPAYMAPEQFREPECGPHSDQFAFCVLAYEALLGHRPFDRSNETMLLLARDGLQALPESGLATLPSWLSALIRRGLAHDPQARFDDMAAIVAELEVHLRHVSPLDRWLNLISVVATLPLATAGWLALSPSDPCPDPRQQWRTDWGDAAVAEMGRRFESTGLGHARDTFQRVSTRVDDYVERWSDLHEAACSAGKASDPGSGIRMDARFACLRRAKDQTVALLAQFRQPDGTTIENAIEAVHGLPGLAKCESADEFVELTTLPSDPARAAMRLRAESTIDAARASHESGRSDPALADLNSLEPEIEASGDRALRARYLGLRGEIRADRGALERGARDMETGLVDAVATRQHRLAAQLDLRRVRIRGYMQGQHQWASEQMPHLRARVDAAGSPHGLVSDLLSLQGVVHGSNGRFEDSVASFRAQHAHEYDHAGETPRAAMALLNMANTRAAQGRWHLTAELERRAITLFSVVIGPKHPRMSLAYANHADTLAKLGRRRQAREMTHEAHEVCRSGARGSPMACAMYITNVAADDMRRGDLDSAQTRLEELEAAQLEVGDRGHPSARLASTLLVHLHGQRGDFEAARRAASRAQQMLAKDGSGDWRLEIDALEADAQLSLRRGELRQAADAYEHAIANTLAHGKRPGVDRLARLRGWAALLDDRPAEAVGHFEAALQTHDHGWDESRLGLATALWKSGRVDEARERLATARLEFAGIYGEDAPRLIDHDLLSAAIEAARNRPDLAERDYRSALTRLASERRRPWRRAAILRSLAHCERARGRSDAAHSHDSLAEDILRTADPESVAAARHLEHWWRGGTKRSGE